MTSKFDKYLENDKPKAPLTPPSKSKHEKRVTVKISESAMAKIKILKMATDSTQNALLDQAVNLLFENTRLENQKVTAYETILKDYQAPDEYQTSIEDFIESPPNSRG